MTFTINFNLIFVPHRLDAKLLPPHSAAQTGKRESKIAQNCPPNLPAFVSLIASGMFSFSIVSVCVCVQGKIGGKPCWQKIVRAGRRGRSPHDRGCVKCLRIKRKNEANSPFCVVWLCLRFFGNRANVYN